MRRLQLFELHDFTWCPKAIRDGLTDFLETSIDVLDTYGPARTVLTRALDDYGMDGVLDLCSGAGGPWVHWLRKGLVSARVTLTDKFPNLDASRRLGKSGITGLRYYAEPVDATSVPAELSGVRTIFTAFHHFPPDQARAVIDDAVRKGQPIAIFELTSRTLPSLLSMLLSPIGVWFLTPRMQRAGWKKGFLTYVVPIIPLVVLLDGIVSCLRTYSVEDLKSMATAPEYTWLIGELARRSGPITYLVGHPICPFVELPARVAEAAGAAAGHRTPETQDS